MAQRKRRTKAGQVLAWLGESPFQRGSPPAGAGIKPKAGAGYGAWMEEQKKRKGMLQRGRR